MGLGPYITSYTSSRKSDEKYVKNQVYLQSVYPRNLNNQHGSLASILLQLRISFMSLPFKFGKFDWKVTWSE